MVKKVRYIFFWLILGYSISVSAQVNALDFDEKTENSFIPYMYSRHGGPEGLAEFKANDHYNYLKELWYFSRSFYVIRNYRSNGVTMDEAIIDITRFEKSRKENEEFILEMPGFKDVIVLLPVDKLIYKPEIK